MLTLEDVYAQIVLKEDVLKHVLVVNSILFAGGPSSDRRTVSDTQLARRSRMDWDANISSNPHPETR